MRRKGDAPGMRGYRTRNGNGRLRQKRNDTHAGTIERIYGVKLDVRSDKHLKNVLRDAGVRTLSHLIEKQ
jgi:hypothetical protein